MKVIQAVRRLLDWQQVYLGGTTSRKRATKMGYSRTAERRWREIDPSLPGSIQYLTFWASLPAAGLAVKTIEALWTYFLTA